MTTTSILINAILSAAVITVIVGGLLYAVRSSRRVPEEPVEVRTAPSRRLERPRERTHPTPAPWRALRRPVDSVSG